MGQYDIAVINPNVKFEIAVIQRSPFCLYREQSHLILSI